MKYKLKPTLQREKILDPIKKKSTVVVPDSDDLNVYIVHKETDRNLIMSCSGEHLGCRLQNSQFKVENILQSLLLCGMLHYPSHSFC